MTPAAWVWGVSGALFLVGALFLALRRQLLAMLIGLELMMNAVNVALVWHAARRGDPQGLAVALLLIAVAAAEAVVGLSLILVLAQEGGAGETEEIRELAG